MSDDLPTFKSIEAARGWVAAKIDSGDFDPNGSELPSGVAIGWLDQSCGCKSPLRYSGRHGVFRGHSNNICKHDAEPDILDRTLEERRRKEAE